MYNLSYRFSHMGPLPCIFLGGENMKDRILKLLGNGVAPSLVCCAVGCSESYVSQLLSDQEFAFEVAKLRCKDLEALRERDDRYDMLEDKLLDKLEHILPFLSRPRDIISALKEINQAKRRSTDLLATSQQPTVVNNIVVLHLPTRTTTAFSLNKNNEVVAIGEQSLATMPTSALLSSLREVERERESSVIQERVRELTTRKEPQNDISIEETRSSQKALSSPKQMQALDENSV
jgi:hypothetical protein